MQTSVISDRPVLEDLLQKLDRMHERFPGNTGRLLPDLVLHNLIHDVREHSRAVLLLSEHGIARSGMVNARTALESALEAGYLTRSHEKYLERGALARVHEILERIEMERRHASLPGMAVDSSLLTDPEEVVKEEAASFEELAPGRGMSVSRAYLELVRSGRTHRSHWSGLAKVDVYTEVLGDDADGLPQGPMADVLYGMLSSEAHPRPRTGLRNVEFKGGGVIEIRPLEEDDARLFGAAVLAVSIAIDALERRSAFPDDG